MVCMPPALTHSPRTLAVVPPRPLPTGPASDASVGPLAPHHPSSQTPYQSLCPSQSWTLRMGNGGQDCCRARPEGSAAPLTWFHTCARDRQATVWGDASREVRAASRQWLNPCHLGGPKCPLPVPPFNTGVQDPWGSQQGAGGSHEKLFHVQQGGVAGTIPTHNRVGSTSAHEGLEPPGIAGR